MSLGEPIPGGDYTEDDRPEVDTISGDEALERIKEINRKMDELDIDNPADRRVLDDYERQIEEIERRAVEEEEEEEKFEDDDEALDREYGDSNSSDTDDNPDQDEDDSNTP